MATTNFSDWTKIFGDFKAPSVDMNSLMAQYRRNAETGSAIMQIFTESAQANARRFAELARSNAEHMMKASKDAFNQSSPEAAAGKQADFAKSWLESNVNSVREIAETSTKSTQEAFDILSKHVAEQVKDFSDAARKAPGAMQDAMNSVKKKAA